MADLTVNRIEPAQSAVERVRWEHGRPGSEHQGQRQRRAPSLPQPIAAALPNADPEQCEMVYEFDSAGEVVGLTVRDTVSRSTIARFNLEQFVALVAGSGQCGVLFERRG